MAELLVLSYAYDVPLSAWFEGEGDVHLTEHLGISRANTRAVMPGKPTVIVYGGAPLDRVTAELRGAGVADVNAAERLGLPVAEVTKVALKLWGHSLTAERNARLGDLSHVSEKSRRARRGRMTRRLCEEITREVGE